MANPFEVEVVEAARDLVSKLGKTLTWQDRDKGFAEYSKLCEMLKHYDSDQPKAQQRPPVA